MTQEALNHLHLQNLANSGVYYYGDDGKVYIGTSNGRLKLLEKAQIVTFKPTNSIQESNVQEAIQEVDSSTVKSVTGLNTDNTDEQNPIVKLSVDGVTITGDGTLTSPLIGTAASGLITSVLDTSTIDLNTTTGVLTANFINAAGYITLSNLSSGTGINYNNTTGVITNTLPDQTIVLTSGTGISATGTYPNFTITNTAPSTTSGTVTSVSVTTANGVSGTVATATTTPAISLTLGAITPSSVNSVVLSGSATPTLSVTGTASISNINTGDQTTVSGNAGTATILQTARNINGVSFNGSADIAVDPDILMYQDLGSTIVAQTTPIDRISTSGAFSSGGCGFIALHLNKAATLNGVIWYQQTAGVYTASNYNGIGLFSVSGTTLTLVASSTTDGNIWKAASAGFASKGFSSTYPASAGTYVIVYLYSSSAQSTAPAIGLSSAPVGANVMLGGFTNSAKLYGTTTGNTALPSPTILWSSITVTGARPWFGLY